jgi:enoyl-[acyl-carrier protein] reductase/trans-2-enoyl-CoA reductase (NAD+)
MCVNAHPIGCTAQVRSQINYVKAAGRIESPRRVLVIGASNGYGLAARIVSAFATGAATVGLGYERTARPNRTATAGWYNIEAFRREARQAGIPAWNVNGDAFSDAVKTQVAELVKSQLGKIDLLVYSIAAPRRIDPLSGEIYTSVIKPIGRPFTAKTVDFLTGKVSDVTAEPATAEEIDQTVKVMGGEDWKLWIERLKDEGLLAKGFLSLAFSYIGSERTRPLYRDGTIGAAKKDLEHKVHEINRLLSSLAGRALISVNKALVTRASAVIPAVPLYIALLYRVMKEKQLHEGCIQQMVRLYRDFLFAGHPSPTDEKGRLRLDDWEMRPDVQQEVDNRWRQVNTEPVTNLTGSPLADIRGMRDEFLRHHGFGMPGVDYEREIDPESL